MNISVIIPTYNRYKLLKRAIQSILLQTYLPKEIIVIDDGSTDATCNIQKDFPNIIYLYQKNRGVSAARNRGIEIAQSDWIAFLDSDDEFYPQKLQKQVDFHKENPDILMSYTQEQWVRNGVVVKIPKKYRKIGKDAFIENLSYCNIAPSSVMLHKSLLETVGLFDEHLEVCEDYDLWLRITCKHKIGLINEKLIRKYAGHDAQLGFRKNMDVYRIKALKKLLLTCKSEEKRLLIQNELAGKIVEQQKKGMKT
ncbi:glycosyltransferase family 2 protein [Sulfurimonas sediminis]|uniref:Glycosyltransferase family 2 protein n=1 Tax=Sulfurimonas sediminis TaxID=2590020 RepID=A0A7M1B0I0_9BACT|nr:glycosyltransferase family A protein [Sulfurimonas sediminis]QOP43213.1 glycosyltransferase family 2 protein [Sulfurimonas sediminis]